MIPIGHVRNRETLEQYLPQTSLFLGPKSVGKWTLAEYLLKQHRFTESDILRVQFVTADSARSLHEFASRTPMGERKAALLEVSGASEKSMNILLKLLEEPPATFGLILISSTQVLPTILSRCQVFQFGYLSIPELSEIYELGGVSEAEAAAMAALSDGFVHPDLNVDLEAYRAGVLGLAQALRDGDADILTASIGKEWTEEKQRFFEIWLMEVITGRWRIFSATTARGISGKLASAALASMRQGNRPGLMMKVQLSGVLQQVREGKFR